jgi:hypothetical protein
MSAPTPAAGMDGTCLRRSGNKSFRSHHFDKVISVFNWRKRDVLFYFPTFGGDVGSETRYSNLKSLWVVYTAVLRPEGIIAGTPYVLI